MEELVKNAELLVNHFGKWPSFHDSEVLEAKFRRKGTSGPSLTLKIFVFETTKEVGPNRCLVRRKKSTVELRFDGIELLSFEDFGVQNVLWDLLLSKTEPGAKSENRILVELPTSYGLSGSLTCETCTAVGLEPYDEST